MPTDTRKYELKARAERQAQTRDRIVQATMELHREVGPARTTVAEIARRARVQRLTVYNHFRDDADLFKACQGRWMGLNPLPDLSGALALEDSAERVRAVLRGMYGWYRKTAMMAEKIHHDRGAVPALDALMQQTADANLGQLAGILASGFRLRGSRSIRQRAVLRLALDFWTWDRLRREGLDEVTAADVMTEAVASVTLARPPRRR